MFILWLHSSLWLQEMDWKSKLVTPDTHPRTRNKFWVMFLHFSVSPRQNFDELFFLGFFHFPLVLSYFLLNNYYCLQNQTTVHILAYPLTQKRKLFVAVVSHVTLRYNLQGCTSILTFQRRNDIGHWTIHSAIIIITTSIFQIWTPMMPINKQLCTRIVIATQIMRRCVRPPQSSTIIVPLWNK